MYSIDLPVTGFQPPFDLPETNLSVSDFEYRKDKTLVYPNPVEDRLVVINAKGFDITNNRFSLFELQGKKMVALNYSIAIDSVSVKFSSSLAPGAYPSKNRG